MSTAIFRLARRSVAALALAATLGPGASPARSAEAPAGSAATPAAAGADELDALAAGREHLAAGAYGEAAKRLGALEVRSPAADSVLGRALALDRRYLAAEPPLRRAVEAGLRDAQTLFYYGSTLWENGKLDEAAFVLEQALEASGGHPAILHQLGRLELWRGNWAAAVERLERAHAAAPGEFEVALDRARALEGAGRTAEALAAYHDAVARAPEHSGARYGLARLLLASGAGEKGRRELETFRRLHRAEQEATREAGRERAALDRGLALLHGGDATAAVEHLSALPPTPDHLDALARALDAAGRPAEASAALERAVALAPGRRDLRDRLTASRLRRPPAER